MTKSLQVWYLNSNLNFRKMLGWGIVRSRFAFREMSAGARHQRSGMELAPEHLSEILFGGRVGADGIPPLYGKDIRGEGECSPVSFVSPECMRNHK